jgi:hypothetical protein
MPSFDFTLKWHAGHSFREEVIKGTYELHDVKLEKCVRGDIPIEGLNWQIGVIVGSSGSGKTSIAKHCWPDAYFADQKDRYTQSCFVNDFPAQLGSREIFTALSSSGFCEPPSWLKSYSVLSQGQKMRVDIAYALLLPSPLVVFDEFTSVVDRTVAKVGSLAISKSVRKHPGKQFIAVTCHFDVLDWLEPDWSYCVDTNTFTDYTSTLQPGVTPNGTTIEVKKNEIILQCKSQSTNVETQCGEPLGSITI